MQPSDAGNPEAATEPLNGEEAPRLPNGPWGRWPGVTYVLPFLVYMLVGMFEPGSPKKPEQAPLDGEAAETVEDLGQESEEHKFGPDVELDEHGEPQIPYKYYPRVYTIKIALTVLTMLLVLPGYLVWPLRVNAVAVLVGVVGVVLWIGVCKLDLEQKLLVPMGLGKLVGLGERPGFNPLEQLKDDPSWAYGFLAIRLLGLAIVVPIIEEFFLRVFLVRFVMDVDWFKIPFGKVDRLGLIVAVAFPMLMHPGELFAAFVWFSLITWLMLWTRNIWDCVVAHAVTNALLGAYVIATGEWQFM